jgi:uncharacterized phage protein (TIGR02216 family)
VFRDDAARLAGLAGALLAWRPDEFWRATPAEFASILSAVTGPDYGPGAERDDLDRLKRMFPDG